MFSSERADATLNISLVFRTKDEWAVKQIRCFVMKLKPVWPTHVCYDRIANV
jgi:hypothetical protein